MSNPNPNFTPITQSSSSNPPKFNPNWIELPEDIWLLILSNLYTTHIIENVQKVCRLFRKICTKPSMFQVIDMTLLDARMFSDYDVNGMTRYAVDRSAGELVDVYVEYCCDDDTLLYIAERSKKLKHLRIGHNLPISDDGLIKAVQKLPMLEEVEIIICVFSTDTYEALGHACPTLKSFSVNDFGSRRRFRFNREAFAIAKTMPNLCHLQLIGNGMCMTNEGLEAILDGCPLLESLDIRTCFSIDLSGELGKRCDNIMHLRRPSDSTADCSHRARTDSDIISSYRCDLQVSDYDYDSDESGIDEYYPSFLLPWNATPQVRSYFKSRNSFFF